MRLGPAARAGGGARAVLDRLHPRHGAGLPQADDRAARRVRRTDLRGALRRRALRARAAARDHRRARSPTSSSRTTSSSFPALRGQRAPLGRASSPATRSSHRSGVCRPCSPAIPEADRSALGRRSAEEFRRTHRRPARRASTSSAASAARHRCPGLEFMARPRPTSTSTATPTRSTTPAREPLGADLAQRCRRASRTSEPWELPDAAARTARRAALPLPRLARLGRRRADAAPRRLPRRDATHRVIVSKGPLAEQIRLHDNMCGEGYLPQPAILPQVDLVITHGGNNTTCEALPPRQADGRRCRSSGISTTTRSASHETSLGLPPLDLRVRRRRADRRRRPRCSPTPRCARASTAMARRLQAPLGHRRGGRSHRAALRLVLRQPEQAGRVAPHSPRPGAVAPAPGGGPRRPEHEQPDAALAADGGRGRERARAVEDQLDDLDAERARLAGRGAQRGVGVGPAAHARHGGRRSWGRPARRRRARAGSRVPSTASSAKRCARASSGTSSVSSITGRPVVAAVVPRARSAGCAVPSCARRRYPRVPR